MKILLISQYFPPEIGATQTRMFEFARHLSAQGHDVYVVCEIPNHPSGIIPKEHRGKWYYREIREGVTILHTYVITFRRKMPFTRIVFYASFMISAIAGGLSLPKCDIILVTSPPLLTGLSAFTLSRLFKIPYVLDIRDLWPAAAVALGELSNPRLIRLAERIERFLYRHATAVTAVTQGFCSAIKNHGVIHPEQVHWLPNGTVPALFRPLPPSPELKEQLGLKDCFVVTFAGTHGIAQDLFTLLEAASRLLGHPTIRFLFIGDGPVKHSLIEEARKQQLSNVVFHDQVELDKIAEYIAISDVMSVPLRKADVFNDFIPSKLFDFMACARPVLLSVPGEARNILERAQAGLYIPPGDVDALVAAIIELEQAPREGKRLGENGKTFVLEHFTRENSSKQLESILTVQGANAPQ